MQGCVLSKDGEQQVPGNMCVEPHSALNKSTQPDVSLQDDQGAGFFVGELIQRQQNFLDNLPAAEAPSEQARAANAGQSAPDLGLKQDDDRDRHVGHGVGKDGMQQLQPEPHREVINDDKGED